MRLIDADALKEELRNSWIRKAKMPMEADPFLAFAMSDIDNAPTIDAKPRLASRWIDADLDPNFAKCKKCSEHKVDIAYRKDFIKQERWNFCPYCGADMRGK